MAGVALFGAGSFLAWFKVDLVPNPKAVFFLGFIPLSMAFSSWITLHMLVDRPKEMDEAITSITDERLIAIRNEAEAIANRIIRWLIFLYL